MPPRQVCSAHPGGVRGMHALWPGVPAAVKSPRRRRGCPALVRGDTNVVSTASWAPWCDGRPLVMTSMRRLSKRSTDGTFKSESNVWVVTLAPASRHTLAAARTQRLLHTEDCTHRSFYTDVFYTNVFTHRSFYTQTPLHTETFTHRRFYTQTL